MTFVRRESNCIVAKPTIATLFTFVQVRQLLAEYFFSVRLWRTVIQPFKCQQCAARMAKNSQYNWYADCVGPRKFTQSICFRFEHIERVSFARFQEYRAV